MSSNEIIRIYDLAKALKIDTKRVIEELRREGVNVSVPSNSVSKEIADKVGNRLLQNKKNHKQSVKLMRKTLIKKKIITNKNGEINIKESISNSQSGISEREKKTRKLQNEIDKLKKRIRKMKEDIYYSNLFKSLLLRRQKQLSNKITELDKLISGGTIGEKDNNSKQKIKKNVTIKNSITNSPNNFHNIIQEKQRFKPIIKEKVFWTLLPKGEWLFSQLTKHFKKLSLKKKWQTKILDENRLQKIEETLKPYKVFVGNDEFEGYVVYCFERTDNVVLECPFYGNAIYIIKKGKTPWQQIARATKFRARNKYAEQVIVIRHSETWLERLEQNLKYGL